jgi:hypothetical protein
VTDTTATQLPTVSLTPDKLFYSLKLWIEQIKVAITRDAAAKATLLEQLSQERLAEAKAMAEAGKTDLANQALAEANAKLAEAQKAIEAANAADKDISKLTAEVNADQAKFAVVLTSVLAKAPADVQAQLQPAVTDLLTQVAATQDTVTNDDKAAEEAAKIADEAKLKTDLSAMQPRMVLVLNAMSKASGKSLNDVLAMYKKNPGLGNIAKALGLKMGAVQHAAQIQWMMVNKDGSVTIDLNAQPTTTPTAPATAPTGTQVTAPTAATTTVTLDAKTEADDEDKAEDAARLEISKGKGKEKQEQEHGKGQEKSKEHGNGKH